VIDFTIALKLSVYQFCVHYFGGSVADIVHPTNPFHLIVCFEFFGHTLTLCHLIYEPKKHILSLLVNLRKVFAQFTAYKQVGI